MADKGNVRKDAQDAVTLANQLGFNVQVQETGGLIKQTLVDLTEENKKKWMESYSFSSGGNNERVPENRRKK